MIDTLIDGSLYITNGSEYVSQEAIDRLGIGAVVVVAHDIMGYLYKNPPDELCTMDCHECGFRKCSSNKVYCYETCSKCPRPSKCLSLGSATITADIYEIPIRDTGSLAMGKMVKMAAKQVTDCIKSGKRTLLTCKGGMSRSSIVAICAIHDLAGMEWDEARKTVEKKHPMAQGLNNDLLDYAKEEWKK